MNTLPVNSIHSGEVLRGALLATLSLLHRRRASEIPDGYIDDYVKIDFGTGCLGEPFDLIERDHVRVVVQTQKRRAVLFHDVRLRHPAALA